MSEKNYLKFMEICGQNKGERITIAYADKLNIQSVYEVSQKARQNKTKQTSARLLASVLRC